MPSFIRQNFKFFIALVAMFALVPIAMKRTGGNVVGNVQVAGVVLDKKWQRFPVPTKLNSPDIEDIASFRCTLQLCEDDAIVVAGVIAAAGLTQPQLASAAGASDAESAVGGLGRERAIDLFRQFTRLNRDAVIDGMKGFIVGSLSGYRLIPTLSSPSAGVPSIVMDVIAVGQKIVLVMVQHKRGDMDRAEAIITEVESGIRVSGQRAVE